MAYDFFASSYSTEPGSLTTPTSPFFSNSPSLFSCEETLSVCESSAQLKANMIIVPKGFIIETPAQYRARKQAAVSQISRLLTRAVLCKSCLIQLRISPAPDSANSAESVAPKQVIRLR